MKTLLIISLFFTQTLWAQTLNRTVTVESSESGNKVSIAGLTEQANRQMAQDLIVEFVGAETFNRNKTALTTHVINSVSKFTPFQKVEEIDRGPTGTRMTIQYKVSLTDFRKLLTEAGIFSKERLAPNILAFFVVENDKGERQSVSWSKSGADENQGLLFEWSSDFKKIFEKAGYTYNKNLNPAWLETFSDTATVEDFVSKNGVKNSVVFFGVSREVLDPRSGEKVLSSQIKVYSQELGKEVTDSVRRFRLRDDSSTKWESWAQDLVTQLDEVDAKSLRQESRMKLTLNGSLSLVEQDSFKQWLLNSTPLIKSVSERRYESDRVLYEIETDATAQELASKLGTLEYKGRKFRTQFGSSEIRMEAL